LQDEVSTNFQPFNADHRHQQFVFVVVFVSLGASLVTIFDSQPERYPSGVEGKTADRAAPSTM
jgi:hypothetical protein